jgi:hypothetical protein
MDEIAEALSITLWLESSDEDSRGGPQNVEDALD